MKVLNYKEVLPIAMDNAVVKNVAARVMIGKEDGADNFCMRVFEMEKNGYTPKHSHDWEHEIFVHTGNGEAFIDGSWYPVSAGSTIFIPPNVEHQFRNTNDALFTFVCLVPAGVPEL
ncbi:MAG: cupin domain-containing protein [Pseudomonadota bacterium]